MTNIGTNQIRTATTGANGAFSVADFEVVEYQLEVSAQGFKKAVIDHVKVDTASIATVNIKLETGAVETKVTVEASAVMIDTSSGTLNSTVTQRQIEDGTTGGGVINATTRSGTNGFHGTALWYNRNPEFAAAPFTQASTNRPAPTLKYNQFSLAAGEPALYPESL